MKGNRLNTVNNMALKDFPGEKVVHGPARNRPAIVNTEQNTGNYIVRDLLRTKSWPRELIDGLKESIKEEQAAKSKQSKELIDGLKESIKEEQAAKSKQSKELIDGLKESIK